MNKLFTIVILSLLISVLAACGQAATPAPTSAPAKPAAAATTASAAAALDQKWIATLAEAKKEGKVTLYGIWTPAIRDALTKGFKEKYGIELEFSPFTRGTDMLAKVDAERRAGLYLADGFCAGNPTLVVTMKPTGFLAPIKPMLMLPEVLSAQAWQGGNVPFGDKDGIAVSLIAVVQKNIAYSTDLVKDGEIKTVKDLLKPQYKGKITLNDPSVTGTGNSLTAHLGHILWNDAQAQDFLMKLLKDQQAIIERDQRIQVESVARGKYAVAVAPQQTNLAEFLSLGAAIRAAPVEEDSIITAAAGAFSVADKAAHPNATAVFVNWLLSKEGMSIFSKAFGNPSSRVDVTTAGINPIFIPVPGTKYYMETEDVLVARGQWLDMAKKVMDAAAK